MNKDQILDEASRLLAAKYKILNRDQAYTLLAERYADVIDQALSDGTTDPRAIARIGQDELRAEADWMIYSDTNRLPEAEADWVAYNGLAA